MNVSYGNKWCWIYQEIVIGSCTCEDLNMVEKREDKTSACGLILSNKEELHKSVERNIEH